MRRSSNHLSSIPFDLSSIASVCHQSVLRIDVIFSLLFHIHDALCHRLNRFLQNVIHITWRAVSNKDIQCTRTSYNKYATRVWGALYPPDKIDAIDDTGVNSPESCAFCVTASVIGAIFGEDTIPRIDDAWIVGVL